MVRSGIQSRRSNSLYPAGALTSTLTRILIGALCVLVGCARSDGFRDDQQYSRESTPEMNVANRIEKMGQPKKRIVVLDFMNVTPIQYGELGKFSADELRRELFLSQRVIVPTEVESRFGTREYIDGDNVKVAQLIREGRSMGVASLVIGRVSKIVFRQRGDEVGVLRQTQSLAAVEIEIKLFDVAGGREVMATSRSGEASSSAMVAFEGKDMQSTAYRTELIKLAIRNTVKTISPQILLGMEKMQWEGKIAKITGSKVVLNSGRMSGLVGGDILRVLTPGEDVYDPATGAYLGRTDGQLKGTLEVQDFVGPDAALAVVHTGGQFQLGDVVRLY